MARYPAKIQKFLDEFQPAPYSVGIDSVQGIKDKIFGLQEKIAELSKKLLSARAVFDTICPHKTQKVNLNYFEGSYLDRAYTEYDVVCTDCGKKLCSHTEMHDHYG